jgi:hypothetical protein
MFDLGWLAGGHDSRAIRLTKQGSVALRTELGVLFE